MSRVQKSYEISSFKAIGDPGAGLFEAIVSVFGNVDFQGDRVVKGAFKNAIEAWKDSDDPVPVIWSHNWGDPFAHIGKVLPSDLSEVEETDEHPGGLRVLGTLDIHKPFAKQVYDLMLERRVKEFSFAYDVVREEKNTKDGANDLLEITIIEVGPTLKGANPDTVSLGVKAQLEQAHDRQSSAEIIAAAMKLDPELAKALAEGTVTITKPEPEVDEKLLASWDEAIKHNEELDNAASIEAERLRKLQEPSEESKAANDELIAQLAHLEIVTGVVKPMADVVKPKSEPHTMEELETLIKRAETIYPDEIVIDEDAIAAAKVAEEQAVKDAAEAEAKAAEELAVLEAAQKEKDEAEADLKARLEAEAAALKPVPAKRVIRDEEGRVLYVVDVELQESNE